MAICRILADHQTGFNAVSKVSMEWIDSNDEDIKVYQVLLSFWYSYGQFIILSRRKKIVCMQVDNEWIQILQWIIQAEEKIAQR